MKRRKVYSMVSDGTIRTMKLLEFDREEDRNPAVANIYIKNSEKYKFYKQTVQRDGLKSRSSIDHTSRNTKGPLFKSERMYKHQSVIGKGKSSGKYRGRLVGMVDSNSPITDKSMLVMYTEYIERGV